MQTKLRKIKEGVFYTLRLTSGDVFYGRWSSRLRAWVVSWDEECLKEGEVLEAIPVVSPRPWWRGVLLFLVGLLGLMAYFALSAFDSFTAFWALLAYVLAWVISLFR